MTIPREDRNGGVSPQEGASGDDPMPGLWWTAALSGEVEGVGGCWTSWTSLEPGDALGEGWLAAIHPEDAASVRQSWHASVAGGRGFVARFRIGPGRDGLWRALIARAEPRRDPLGQQIGWAGLAIEDPDVPPVPASAASSVRVEDFDFAIFWIADGEQFGLRSVSPSCERLLGLKANDLTGDRRCWSDLAHPEDRARVLDAYERRRLGEPAEVEYRLLRPDGAVAHVRDRVLPALTRSMGAPGRLFGVLEDVPPPLDRVDDAAEVAEAPSAAALESILEALPIGAAIAHDPRCLRVTVNRALRELLRLGPGVSIAPSSPTRNGPSPFRILRDGRPLGVDELPLSRAAATGLPCNGVVLDLAFDDGTTKAVLAHAAPLPGVDGRRRGAVATYADLSAISPAAGAEARHANDRLAELVGGLGDLFTAMDADWRVNALNGRAAEVLGIDRPSALGRTLWELEPELQGTTAEFLLRRAMAERTPVDFRYFHGRACRWIESRVFPINGGLAILGRDVTEPQAERLALLEIEERYRLATEAIVGLVYDWRIDSGHVHRSTGLAGLLGIAVEDSEPTDAWWRALILPEDRPARDAEIARLVADPSRSQYSIEYRVRHREGRAVDLWDRGFCVRDEGGRALRIVGSVVDVSERRRAEHALREADRMKDEFLGVLAHELRNPLAPILGAAQALLADRDRTRDDAEELPVIIERQARHMGRLIDDLLDVSRISHGKIAVRPKPINAVELVEQTLGNFADQFREGRLTLRAEMPKPTVPVMADPTRLAQCLSNLLQNASKFTEPGGAITVGVSVDADAAEAVISVRDTGIGIASEDLPKLFRAYSQADGSLDRSRGGLGLGLALVKSLIEAQKGRVEVRSEGIGRGSLFALRLPLRTDLAARIAPTAAAPPLKLPKSDAAARSFRLLVVDDRPDMAHLLSRLLRGDGHEVTVAADAEQALEAARSLRPEVVISDIGLPGPVDGYGLARALRREPATAGALLIAVTGYARPDDRERALAAGFDDHLTKPLDFPALRKRLVAVAPRDGDQDGRT